MPASKGTTAPRALGIDLGDGKGGVEQHLAVGVHEGHAEGGESVAAAGPVVAQGGSSVAADGRLFVSQRCLDKTIHRGSGHEIQQREAPRRGRATARVGVADGGVENGPGRGRVLRARIGQGRRRRQTHGRIR